MLHGAETGAADDLRSEATASASHIPQVGGYLTDGIFLYRVIDVVLSESGETAELEDCYGLDTVRVSLGDLQARRLRVVTPV